MTSVFVRAGRRVCLAQAVMVVWILTAARTAAAPPPGYALSWADEFDGTALNTNLWGPHSPGKRRSAVNVMEAASVSNGLLTIATWTEGDRHLTGMIRNSAEFDRVRGYVEARIRFDTVPGMWSAFWMMPRGRLGDPRGDPAKGGVEVDIVEHRAVDKGGKDIADCAQHTLHWDGYGKDHKSNGTLVNDLGLREGFHVYAVEWTDREYRFLVDGRQTWASGPVSMRPEYVILSSEIEDKGWAGDIPAGGYVARAASRARMVVDYVRYYLPTGEVKAAAAAVPELAWVGDVHADLAPLSPKILDLCRAKLPALMDLLGAPGWQPPAKVEMQFSELGGTPACAAGNKIQLGISWFRSNPGDIGCAVHELVHVLQAYPRPRRSPPGSEVRYTKPGWLVEGLADYLRWVVCCPERGALPTHFKNRSYRESYRTAAVFLDWVAGRSGKKVLTSWNTALRAGEFHDGLIEKETGKKLDDLWAEFQAAKP